jgi:AcrR family transcriptional regulator
MAAIAEAAGVAVQTVYFTFHTKRTLLSRAIDFAVMGEDEPRIPQKQPWYQRMQAEQDIGTALRDVVIGCGEIIRRVAPITVVARATAEPEVTEVLATHERWRADGYREMLGVLANKAPLRPGVTVERATHLLLLYVGEEVYGFLVGTYRWTHEEWVAWTVATVEEQLFGRGSGNATAS